MTDDELDDASRAVLEICRDGDRLPDAVRHAVWQRLEHGLAPPPVVRSSRWIWIGVAAAAAALPGIDILVNNAGIAGGNARLWELEPAMWRRVLEVNLVAPYLTCRHVVPKMMQRRYGRIVNIASVAGKEGNPNASHYSASKAGLIAMTKSLAKEIATDGIMVNAITPAVAKTAMFEQMNPSQVEYMLAKIPMGRFVELHEVAAMAAWLASEDCSFTTGSVFDLTGGRATY